MSSKHDRLVAAVSDAKEAKGFTWKQIATMGGGNAGNHQQRYQPGRHHEG